MSWESTWLHKIDEYGGQQPMGSGPYGATVWTQGQGPMSSWAAGMGSGGGAWSQTTTLVANQWRSTYLHKVNEFGGQEPMGSGPYGETVWE